MSFLDFAFNLAQNGLSAPDFAIACTRAATGTFFAISGYNKLFDTERHNSLITNLMKNRIPDVQFMQWWVPSWEFFGGVMLVLGFFTSFMAAVLTIICIVACCCEAEQRVESYHPINAGDKVADYLYLPEVLYICLLLVSLLSGGGKYSVDNFIY